MGEEWLRDVGYSAIFGALDNGISMNSLDVESRLTKRSSFEYTEEKVAMCSRTGAGSARLIVGETGSLEGLIFSLSGPMTGLVLDVTCVSVDDRSSTLFCLSRENHRCGLLGDDGASVDGMSGLATLA